MTDASNPYSAPAARVEDAGGGEAEKIRKAHLSHEAGLRSLGMLYYLGGGILVLAAIFSSVDTASGIANTLIMIGMAALGAAQLFLGWAVRELRGWARWPGVALSVLGLLAFPVGSLISIYALWLYLSKKGRMVFSPEYAAVRAATPHVKYRTSIIVWIGFALIIGLFVAIGFGAMSGGNW